MASLRVLSKSGYRNLSTAVVGLRQGGGIRLEQQQQQQQLYLRLYKGSVRCKSTATNSGSKQVGGASEKEASVPLGRTFAAMTAGVLTVAAIASVVESFTASSVPEFDPQGERFDQSNFFGRFCKMFLACDPRLLTYSTAEAQRSLEMVRNYKAILSSSKDNNNNNDDVVSAQELSRSLWEAQRISSAALHPDTGAVCPHPFRMSGYVPFNGPICVAMVSSTSTPALLFWSWVNQSQNALVNYFNRNASSEMTNETLIKSYSVAVASALTVAFGLATLVQKRFDAAKAKTLMRYVAFPSAVVASSLNCYIVRSPEIETGVPLMNADGETLGISQVAAARGVNSTTASRAILQAPVFFLPPLLLSSVFKGVLASNPTMAVPLATYLVLIAFGLGLPATVAIFPQISSIDVADVEEQFQGLTDKDGQPYNVLYYNKGL